MAAVGHHRDQKHSDVRFLFSSHHSFCGLTKQIKQSECRDGRTALLGGLACECSTQRFAALVICSFFIFCSNFVDIHVIINN
jgi:hypothetical protein